MLTMLQWTKPDYWRGIYREDGVLKQLLPVLVDSCFCPCGVSSAVSGSQIKTRPKSNISGAGRVFVLTENNHFIDIKERINRIPGSSIKSTFELCNDLTFGWSLASTGTWSVLVWRWTIHDYFSPEKVILFTNHIRVNEGCVIVRSLVITV